MKLTAFQQRIKTGDIVMYCNQLYIVTTFDFTVYYVRCKTLKPTKQPFPEQYIFPINKLKKPPKIVRTLYS